MKKIVTCEEMKKLDNATIHKIGVASEVLMERAALKVVEETEKYLGKSEKILVVCGVEITEEMVLPLPDYFI